MGKAGGGRVIESPLAVLGDTDFISYTRGSQVLPVKDQMVNS